MVPTTAGPADATRGVAELLATLLLRPDPRGAFGPDARARLAALLAAQPERPLLWTTFPPKSGGTFVSRALHLALEREPRWRGRAAAVRAYFAGSVCEEGQLYYPALLAFRLFGRHAVGVAHGHSVATSTNLELARLFGLRALVMRRPIADMLRSAWDAARERGSVGSFGSAFADEAGFRELSEERRKDYFVRNMGPWYVRYYASWLVAARDEALPVRFLEYERFRADAAATLREVLDFQGLAVRDEAIAGALAQAGRERTSLRFRKGVSGRGRELFGEERLGWLRELTGAYPGLDFDGLL